jgi:hypothetical protein
MTEVVIPRDSPIHSRLLEIARSCETVFVVGIPGVGKSLIVQQLALLAQQEGRLVHLLQWDVTRSNFETEEILSKYPDLENGETHRFIRKAVGMWSRSAILDWDRSFGRSRHLLIAEAPLFGGRLVELSLPIDDDAETILSGDRSRFILPIPSATTRREIAARRAETSTTPQHEREAFDAPPNLLDDAWQEIYEIANNLGMGGDLLTPRQFDPELYEAVFRSLLQHRRAKILRIDEVFEHGGSVYDLKGIASELSATPNEVKDIVRRIEATFDPDEIDADIDDWYRLA